MVILYTFVPYEGYLHNDPSVERREEGPHADQVRPAQSFKRYDTISTSIMRN